jgi:hypothetical protein
MTGGGAMVAAGAGASVGATVAGDDVAIAEGFGAAVA